MDKEDEDIIDEVDDKCTNITQSLLFVDLEVNRRRGRYLTLMR